MNDIREKIKNYFNLTDEEKDDFLVEIVNHYKNVLLHRYDNSIDIIELLDHDLELFIEADEYEAAQAITDIKNAIIKIKNELYGL